MMRWTAAVPLKLNAMSKSRLRDVLDPGARLELVKSMAAHVLGILESTAQIVRVIVLAERCPDGWQGEWAQDKASELNAAVSELRRVTGGGPLLIVHGDLPFLSAPDIAALLDAGEVHGVAMATDRTGLGTNAIAIADDRPFSFSFGQESRRAHAAASGMVVLERPGLARDIDTPEDLAELRASCRFDAEGARFFLIR